MSAPLTRGYALAAFLASVLFSCGSAFQQADLRDFVSTGLSMVCVRESSLSPSATLGDGVYVSSNTPLTLSLGMVNVKNLEVEYSLSWDKDDSFFVKTPPNAPSATDLSHLVLEFNLAQAMEHESLELRLGKYAPSINKTYPEETITVLCDSPPNPASRAATVMDGAQKSLLAILLPTKPTDDDLAELRIRWKREDGQTWSQGSFEIADLSPAPDPDPFSSAYDCYFQDDECVAGYGYEYEVVVIDALGQESSSLTTSSSASLFYLNYYGNGSTAGEVPAALGYRYGQEATVADLGDLSLSIDGVSYVFNGWNTAADGSGQGYLPGDTLKIPAGETNLYAQWYTNSLELSFDVGALALVFNPAAASVEKGDSVTLSCANQELVDLGSQWVWYVDGKEISLATAPNLVWKTAAVAVGQHIIGCAVSYKGIRYSGSCRVAVRQ